MKELIQQRELQVAQKSPGEKKAKQKEPSFRDAEKTTQGSFLCILSMKPLVCRMNFCE